MGRHALDGQEGLAGIALHDGAEEIQRGGRRTLFGKAGQNRLEVLRDGDLLWDVRPHRTRAVQVGRKVPRQSLVQPFPVKNGCQQQAGIQRAALGQRPLGEVEDGGASGVRLRAISPTTRFARLG